MTFKDIMETERKDTIGWVDLLRIIACFLVLVSHCCDPFVAQFGVNRGAFLTGTFIGSLVRPCVPLFVMMTGVLLLPIKMDMADFYKKRLKRIIIPLVFWSIVLPILFFIYLHFIYNHSTNLLILASDHSLASLPSKLYSFIFNFNFDTVPLWYLYMLVGLYLIMPVLSGWLQNATRKNIKLLLILWGVSLVLPYYKMLAPVLGFTGYFGNMDILGGCTWNSIGSFYYVSGFIGYLLLAHYLTKYPGNWSWKKVLLITIPMFVVGFLITFFGYLVTQKYSPGNYANLEIVWYFTGINVFMMTFSIFIIIQKLNIRSTKFLSKIASYTFGIYLCHYVFVTAFYDLFDGSLPYALRIVLMACVTFIVCTLIVWGMSKNKITGLFVK